MSVSAAVTASREIRMLDPSRNPPEAVPAHARVQALGLLAEHGDAGTAAWALTALHDMVAEPAPEAPAGEPEQPDVLYRPPDDEFGDIS